MANAGTGLFHFVKKAHSLIEHGRISISEWHRVVKFIFNQMIEAVDFIHRHNVCHFDISLENFVTNDVQIEEKRGIDKKKSITFLLDNAQATLIDFGLSEYFPSASFKSNKYCGKQLYHSPEIQTKKEIFNAQSNDIYCLGVCLFAMTLGVSPYRKAADSDPWFSYIINVEIKQLLTAWNKLQYVDDDWMDLMKSLFCYEEKRIDLKGMKEHPWLNK